MRIHLQNIKCYTDNTFDFGDNGLALLSGQSGKGKSSIIQGIHFALFGVGSKIISFGKTTCKVSLEFDGIKIERSKNPCKLVVNEIYEDDVGQNIINNKFGVTFDVTGYIPQNAIKSFILMSAQDKLAFIEKFAFDDINLSDMKIKCKEVYSIKQVEFLECTSKLETCMEMLDDFQEPEMVEFPFEVENEDYEKAIQNGKTLQKQIDTDIFRYTEILKKYNLESTDLKILYTNVLNNTKYIDDLKSCTNTFCNDLEYVGDDVLQTYIQNLSFLVSQRELNVLKKQYKTDKASLETMIKNELEELNKKLVDVSTELWLFQSKEEVEESIKSTSNLLKDLERIEMFKRKLNFVEYDNETIKNDIKLLNDKRSIVGVHKCPSCKVFLRLVNDELVNDTSARGEGTKVDLATIDKELKILNNILNSINEINDITESYEDSDFPTINEVYADLNYLRGYEFTQLANEKNIRDLESKIQKQHLSNSCVSFKLKVEEMNVKIKGLETLCKSTSTLNVLDEVYLRSLIDIQQDIKRKIQEHEEKENEMNIKIHHYEFTNKVLRDKHELKYGEIKTVDELDRVIANTSNMIDKLRNQQVKCQENFKQLEKWNRRKEDMKWYVNWEHKISNLQTEETELSNQCGALASLREHILEAESIVMTNIVESINTHAKVYLDDFFEDDPITVTLQSFKQTKKVSKAQLNLDIEYKGMECDLQMLSGGEMSRIVLAYTLALAEMFNTPLLMLDECTASLDQENANHVFDSIKEHFNGKLTIIVAHQVVTGIFDRSIVID